MLRKGNRESTHTEQLDAANLGDHLLGKDLVAGDGLDLNFALRHFVVSTDR